MKITVCATSVVFLLVAASAAVAQERPVERWVKSTAPMTMPDGKVMKKSVEYPVFAGTKKAKIIPVSEPFNNCWDWCRRVCDGYGVCWVTCGTKCSGW